jgi:hypothetical protein
MFRSKQLLLFTLFLIFCHAIINPIAIENADEILETDVSQLNIFLENSSVVKYFLP